MVARPLWAKECCAFVVRDHLVFVEVDGLYVGMDERAHQTHLHLVAQEHVQHLLRAPAAHADVDAGVAFVEGVQDTGQNVRADGERRAQAQVAGLDAAHLFQSVLPFLDHLENALGVGEEDGAGVGEAGAAATAFEQLLAHLALQRLDASGDRGLGELEDLGRTAEAAVGRHLHEGLELPKVQGRPPLSYRLRLCERYEKH